MLKWIAVGLLGVGLLALAAVPRYTVTAERGGLVRVDRWTGQVEIVPAARLPQTSWVTPPPASTVGSLERDLEAVSPAPR
jgi:hypothetical protein